MNNQHDALGAATRRSDTGAGDERAQHLQAQVDALPTIPMSEYRGKSRRSFLVGAGAIAIGWFGWKRLLDAEPKDRIPGPLRDQLERNADLWEVLPSRRAQEFDVSKAERIRVNGSLGMKEPLDAANWTCRVEGPDGEVLDELDIAAFEALPQHDMVIEHKCIEGWSTIVHWGGARFADFHQRFADLVGDVPYVGMETADGGYYVGWDMKSALNPQTMLALRLDDEPLDEAHGAPLRLATPNKYGIKTIKRIAVIRYTHERPADYWAERGYDWYAGF